MSEEQISYNEVLDELKAILEDIRDQNIDVDKLATKVKRARELINICEQRIKKAKMEVEEVIKNSSKQEVGKKERMD
ncbi:exodeoxyribonuclease VII small subunit [bacterium (Candidatus Gribaldobacteria) CG_4_10_14_0_2_um_filter_36_18]|uniref:Exodeoxyribonuclease VII small subunit n=1 Tax=bacterium (Candidatus Gribaldobacteria) CG_4_10_14_0_2_um_filter_36_18 TaxID=2014264 RepID=A0A2M7VK02_9BACT|nr:MAG: exodeoxyribonuclease VII small subunit [bacterium (Candidatus Gribaldobacteria) CG_4_10_14_0_2_um_filter_36_18]